MSREVHTCNAQDSLENAAKIMCEHSVRRLVVIRDNTAIGIVTLAELLRNEGRLRLGDKILHELLGVRRKHSKKNQENVIS